MSFDALIASMGTLMKAQGLDGEGNEDSKVAAAAAGGAAAGGTASGGGNDGQGSGEGAGSAAAGSTNGAAGEGGSQGAGASAEELEAAEAREAAAAAAGGALAKSFELKLEDGTTLEAFDGGEMLKALGERIDTTDAQIKTALGKAIMVMGSQSQQIADLTKALGETAELAKSYGATITALRTDLDAVRNQPGGRKSVTTPAEVSAASPLVKSLENGGSEEGMRPPEFLAKCLSLQKDGLMSLQECAIAEAAIGSNVAVPDAIRAKVFSSK